MHGSKVRVSWLFWLLLEDWMVVVWSQQSHVHIMYKPSRPELIVEYSVNFFSRAGINV